MQLIDFDTEKGNIKTILSLFIYPIIFLFKINDHEIIDRVLDRKVCPNNICNEVYGPLRKAEIQDICDECKGPLVSRPRDNREDFPKRINKFKRLIKPSLDYYKKNKVAVHFIDASQEPSQVFAAIMTIIEGECEKRLDFI